MMTGTEAMGILVTQHVSPWLRARGFSRSGNRFVRWQGKNCQLIKFLTDKREKKARLFTIYLGAFSKRIWYLEEDNLRAPDVPDQPHCQWGGFLEQFLPRFQDRWFAISSEDQVSGLAREVLELIDQEVLPLLLNVATDEGLRDYWLTGRAPGVGTIQRLTYLAYLCHEIGPNEHVRELIGQLRSEAGDTPAGKRALAKLIPLLER